MIRGRPRKLTPAQCEQVRKWWLRGELLKEIAFRLGVCNGTVWNYVRHMELPPRWGRRTSYERRAA